MGWLTETPRTPEEVKRHVRLYHTSHGLFQGGRYDHLEEVDPGFISTFPYNIDKRLRGSVNVLEARSRGSVALHGTMRYAQVTGGGLEVVHGFGAQRNLGIVGIDPGQARANLPEALKGAVGVALFNFLNGQTAETPDSYLDWRQQISRRPDLRQRLRDLYESQYEE